MPNYKPKSSNQGHYNRSGSSAGEQALKRYGPGSNPSFKRSQAQDGPATDRNQKYGRNQAKQGQSFYQSDRPASPRKGAYEGKTERSFGDKRFSSSGGRDERFRNQGPRFTNSQAKGFTPADKRFGPHSVPVPKPIKAPEISPAQDLEIISPIEQNLEQQVLSGRNPIREALKAGHDLEKLMVQKGELSGSARQIVAMAKDAGVMIQPVEKERLDQITKNHQGLIAIASAYQYSSFEDILNVAKEREEAPFIILLDQITDPHNLGAIIRTASCAGAHGVVVQQHRAVGLTPAAVRASAGAIEHVKVARVVNLNQTITKLKNLGIWVYASDAKGEDYRKVNLSGGCALVIGSEGEGVSRLTQSLCDKTLSIPIAGDMDSLNASVAAGILMYAVYHQRHAL